MAKGAFVMKWVNQKRERYSRLPSGVRGRRDNKLFNINAYSEGFSQDHIGWYVCISYLKTNKNYNSLWDKLWWKDIGEAKKWCERHELFAR